MIRVILFDIDGTLIRTGGAGVRAFAKVFETEFNAVDGFENLKFAGRTDVSLVREFFSFHGIEATPNNFERFFDSYVFWLDYILSQCNGGVCAGVHDFLQFLRRFPEPPLIGLLTGNIRLGAEIKLRRFDLWDEFVTGAFADDHEERPEIAAIARDRAARIMKRKIEPAEVLVIGDTPLDIHCGRAIGARVLTVATAGSTLQQLTEAAPDLAVPNLKHRAAREFVLES
jgi:phosphoglycolate phosphatase-like HAD superfamily hydrolase